MSERTLQRRLQAEGTSFNELLDDSRRTFAFSYQADRKLALDSVFRPWVASALFTLAAPAVTALVAAHDFLRREASEALIAAVCFTGTAAVNLVLEALLSDRMDLVDPAIGFGLPLILVFGATGPVGEIVPMLRRQRAA